MPRKAMDEHEFRRLLDLFPVVRSRDYVAESESSRQSTSRPSQSESVREWQDAWDHGDDKKIGHKRLDQQDAFWKKLKLAAERKVGAVEAEKFCNTFQQIHNKLVNEELSSDTAQNLLKLLKISNK